MFSKIYNPHSKRMVNLKSKKGRKILYNYINYSNKFKGGSQLETENNFNAGKVTKHGCSPDNEEKEEHESDSASSDGGEEEESDEEEEDVEEDDIEIPSLNEIHNFVQMLRETKDETLIDMYNIMLSECDTDPLKVIEKYINNSKISYYNGKYYLGGHLKLIPEDKITPERIQEAKDIGMKKGGPTNSAEANSIFRSEQELKTIETIIKHYIIIMTHIKFRPGGEGMKIVEKEFNLQVSNGKKKLP
jgi:hypothetical protein